MVHKHTKDDATLAIIAELPQIGHRLARVARTAAGFRETVSAQRLGDVPRGLGTNARMIACSAADVAEVAEACASRFPNAWMVVWTPRPSPELFAFAAKTQRVASIVAWPDDTPLPRPWELALPIRRLVADDAGPLQVREFIQWQGIQSEWFPRSTADLHATLEGIKSTLDRLGITARTGRRIVGVAHEMLMNAMYDAPVDDRGQPRFAHSRDQHITLDPHDAPRFILGTDGLTVVLQISDPFGGLRRGHVFDSIRRGLRSVEADARADEIMDTSGGGAGLGLHRIVYEANATVFDVVTNSSTIVTAIFELDRSNRELRKAPRSLHFFQRAETRWDGP